MDRRYVLELLIEDLKYKLPTPSKFSFPCSACSKFILYQSDFIWIGNKKKICIPCSTKIINILTTETTK